MANNLKLFRLLGEEMIAELVSENDKSYNIRNAVRIVIMPNKADPNTPNVGLAPFLQFSDDKEMTIDKNHIITIATPLTDFVNQYNSIFGGVIIPDSKLIKP
jgi:hypothetical protein